RRAHGAQPRRPLRAPPARRGARAPLRAGRDGARGSAVGSDEGPLVLSEESRPQGRDSESKDPRRPALRLRRVASGDAAPLRASGSARALAVLILVLGCSSAPARREAAESVVVEGAEPARSRIERAAREALPVLERAIGEPWPRDFPPRIRVCSSRAECAG